MKEKEKKKKKKLNLIKLNKIRYFSLSEEGGPRLPLPGDVEIDLLALNVLHFLD